MGIYTYKQNEKYVNASENIYNLAFYELIDYVQDVETYLAKSLISTTPEHGAETLTNVWREANLAQTCIAQLPLQNEQLSNTSKFLNQVSEYSYTLSRKNIYNEKLTQEELDNLEQLHDYCVQLENTLNQLLTDMGNGRISWSELTNKQTEIFAQEVSNMSNDSFQSLEETFHEYSGLIYDGAFSEHITTNNPKMLEGEEIDEDKAKQIAKEFIGEDKIKEINSNGGSNNGNIDSYDFWITLNDKEEHNLVISVSKIKGYVIYMNYNRDIEYENITQEQANEIGKKYLEEKGFNNMKETYDMKESGIVTINYAYSQDDVVIYPDLIKLKIALDNGEVLGIETTGYLNSHQERTIEIPKISKEEAKKILNERLEIKSEGMAIIPTKYQTEILCWEFKGTVKESDFLVYINAETGKEEDILLIINTPNGTLTMKKIKKRYIYF